MALTKRQRETLAELQVLTNLLGGELDRTTVQQSAHRWADRAEANLLVSRVLYAVLCDDPENEMRDSDLETGQKALGKLQSLVDKLGLARIN